jgi:hypothetical protein
MIFESVVTIRIDIDPAGEEPDQHIVRVVSRVSRTTTFRKVSTGSTLGLYSRDEILVPSDRLA